MPRRLLFLFLGVLLCPPQARAEDAIPDKGITYQVPYKLTDTMHVLVRVKLEGKGPYNFIIDTGAPINIVSKEIGKKLKLEPDKQGFTLLEELRIEGGVANKKVKIRVETPFQLEGMNAMNFAGVPLHGILGYPMLAQYRMEIDFSQSKMKWTRLDFNPPEPKFLKVKGGAPGGLEAMGSLMKLVSMFIGKRETPTQTPRGFIGISTAEGKGGLKVTEVLAQSPAAKAGFKMGDRIKSVGGIEVHSLQELRLETRRLAPGQELSITIESNGKEQVLTLTAGKGL